MSTDPKPPPPSDDPSTLNVACPHCHAPTGKPLSASTRKDDHNFIDVIMHCRDCNRTWMVQRLTNGDPIV